MILCLIIIINNNNNTMIICLLTNQLALAIITGEKENSQLSSSFASSTDFPQWTVQSPKPREMTLRKRGMFEKAKQVSNAESIVCAMATVYSLHYYWNGSPVGCLVGLLLHYQTNLSPIPGRDMEKLTIIHFYNIPMQILSICIGW